MWYHSTVKKKKIRHSLFGVYQQQQGRLIFSPSVVTGTPEIEAPGLGVTQTTEIGHLNLPDTKVGIAEEWASNSTSRHC